MRVNQLNKAHILLLLSCTCVSARPQTGGRRDTVPWWTFETTSHPAHSSDPPTLHGSPSQQLSTDGETSSSGENLRSGPPLPLDFDMNAVPTTEEEGEAVTGTSSSLAIYPEALMGREEHLRQFFSSLPKTLAEHQSFRQAAWPAQEHGFSIAASSSEAGNRPDEETPGSVASGSGRGLWFSKPTANDLSLPIPLHRATSDEGYFETISYDYYQGNLAHLMVPKRSPRKLDSYIGSMRGSRRLYRPDPDVLHGIERFMHERIGSTEVVHRLLNSPIATYARFLKPSFVEDENMRGFIKSGLHDEFVTIHPAAMERATSTLSRLRAYTKTIYFPTIRINDEDHQIMIVPQRNKLPIKGPRVAGVLLHFWEGLSGASGPDAFPSIRAYLGAMLIDQNRFLKWTDIPSMDTVTLAHKIK